VAKNKKDVVDSWEKLGIRPSSIGQVSTMLSVAFDANPKFTLCLVGETGIGKTPIVHQWADSRGGYVEVLNFGHMNKEEISMPMFTPDATSYDFVKPAWMVRVNKEAEKKGLAVLFLDEWNRSDKDLVNALFTLTDDRRIHGHKLHENVLVVAAMNPSDGSYLVNEAEKDHAIRKRLNFIYAQADFRQFIEYTKKSAWHPLVPAFLKSASQFFYDTGARDAGKCFPCPANWEKVSRIMESAEKNNLKYTDNVLRALVEGQIGSVAGSKFLDFVIDQNSLIQPKEILYEYTEKAKVRKKVAALLGNKINQKGELVKNPNATGSKHGAIHELNAAVAIELFSDMPEVDKIKDHLALYISDLPNDILSAFCVDQLLREAESKEGGKEYFQQISQEMNSHPGYQKKIKVIFQAVNAYKKQARLSAQEDPAA
jgi:hypothetical protein